MNGVSLIKRLKYKLAKVYVYIIKSIPVSLDKKLAIDHKIRFGHWPNLTNPETFLEKQIWRAAFDRRDCIAFTCDKQAMKDYAKSKVPNINIPKTYFLGAEVGDIFSEVPESILEKGWVLKPNHGSGDYIIGKGRYNLSSDDVKGWMEPYGSKKTAGWGGWAYSQARRLYILEELIGKGDVNLFDYKFYIFGGKFASLQLITGRGGVKRRYFLDADWNILHSVEDPLGDYLPECPEAFNRMIGVAEKLGDAYDFIRVDLYYNDGEIWFSELTPYPSTMKSSRSEQLNKMFGDLWILPKDK